MSTISVPSVLNLKGVSKTKTGIKTVSYSSSADYYTIMGITCLFFGIVVLLMIVGPVVMSSYGGPSMGDITKCRQKILGFEQSGIYASQAQFRLAESYCYMK